MISILGFKENGKVWFTKDYVHGTVSRRTIKQGTSAILTRIHRGWFSIHLDVRLEDGTFLRKVPASYFER